MAERIVLLGIDPDELRARMMELLQNEGYEVCSLTTVAEMYAWLAIHGKPDRIICDMFDLCLLDKEYRRTGYHFLIELSRDPRYNDIKFGLINSPDDHPWSWGYAKPELPPQLCFWILKPFTADEFLNAIRNCDGNAGHLGQAPQEEWSSGSPRLTGYPRRSWSLYDEDEPISNWDDFITKCDREMQAQVRFHPETANSWQSILDLLPVLRPAIDYQVYRPRVEFQEITFHIPNDRVVVRLKVLSSREEPLSLRLTRNDQRGSPIYIYDKDELASALLRLLQLPSSS